MSTMTRIGDVALEYLGESDDFTRCLHCVADGDPKRRCICPFPLETAIYSFGSGYESTALLGGQ